jgi:hypothetical protein
MNAISAEVNIDLPVMINAPRSNIHQATAMAVSHEM